MVLSLAAGGPACLNKCCFLDAKEHTVGTNVSLKSLLHAAHRRDEYWMYTSYVIPILPSSGTKPGTLVSPLILVVHVGTIKCRRTYVITLVPYSFS